MNVGLTLLIYGFAGLVIIALLVIAFALGWVVRDYQTYEEDEDGGKQG